MLDAAPGARPLAISIREATRLLDLSRATVYRLIGKGRLKAVKCGSRTLVPMDSLRELLASLRPLRRDGGAAE